MMRFGTQDPCLECSSRGNKRFSAFYARIKSRGNLSIESIYQSGKVFEDNSTGLSIMAAKGRKPVNAEACRVLYSELWDVYFQENHNLLGVIKQYNSFSDVFGKEGHACQAEEIYRIWKSKYVT